MQIPGEATGNPIHLTDSSNLPCEIAVVGNSEQETRSGSNILNFNVTQNSKVTVNDDGTVTINGTGGFSLNISQITLKSGVTYYEKVQLMSGEITSTENLSIEEVFMGFNSSNWITTDSFLSYTPSEDVSKTGIWVNAGATFKNAVIKLWANTDQSDFEQYGAMPSPEYPSEIVTVGQNGSVEIKVNNGLETTDTNYQSYTKTLPIQQEMLEGDYIEDVEHHGWGKYEITGNEYWRKSSNSKNISYFLVANSMLVNIDTKTLSPSVSDSQTKVAIVLSNYFKAISPNQLFVVGKNGICLNLYDNEIQMRLGFGLDSDINTVDKLKAWLKSLYDAGTPVIVYYKLATPKSLELTEDQKSVLNSFYTYKGITNVSMSGIGTLKVNYKKDLETIINKLSATSVAE